MRKQHFETVRLLLVLSGVMIGIRAACNESFANCSMFFFSSSSNQSHCTTKVNNSLIGLTFFVSWLHYIWLPILSISLFSMFLLLLLLFSCVFATVSVFINSHTINREVACLRIRGIFKRTLAIQRARALCKVSIDERFYFIFLFIFCSLSLSPMENNVNARGTTKGWVKTFFLFVSHSRVLHAVARRSFSLWRMFSFAFFLNHDKNVFRGEHWIQPLFLIATVAVDDVFFSADVYFANIAVPSTI